MQMRRRGLNLLLLMLVVFSCTSGTRFEAESVASTTPQELAPSEVASEQRRSLRYLYYRNNDAPPPPRPSELRRLERDLAMAPPVEVQELQDIYGNDTELLVYATRDTDNDGILDYRISEYRGKFFEGDIDVDGDGIRNVYDSAPYDPKRGGVDTNGDGVPDKPGSFDDRDGDGIPDHLDWSRRKPEPLAAQQASLFHDFHLILVERSARATPELVQAVDDTLRYVIREPLPSLRTLAIEDQLLISPDLGDNGFMLAQTQTLTICMNSLEGAAPIVVLGLLVHEVGHAWQLAQDFDAADLAAENVKMHFPPGRFTRSLERFGWKVDRGTLGEGYPHRLYWPHFYATSPRYLYRGSSPNEWAAWFEDVQRESGPEFLRNSPAVTWGMVGPYSLTSPWEWHADHMMAALYNRLDRGLDLHANRTYRNISGLLRKAMLESIQRQWSRYDYRNAVGTSIDRELGRRFALTPDEVQELVDRYVIPLADFPMLSEALALETALVEDERAGFAGFGSVVDEAIGDLREELHEPMRERPDLHTLVALGLSPWDSELTYAADTAPVDEAGEVDSDSAGEEPVDDGELEAMADPDLDLELPEATVAGPHSVGRSGLPIHRGGAGRVGGYASGPRGPGDATVDDGWGAGDPEADEAEQADEAGAAELGDESAIDPAADEADSPTPETGMRGVDPLGFLFEQLRRVTPAGPQPDTLPNTDDEDGADAEANEPGPPLSPPPGE